MAGTVARDLAPLTALDEQGNAVTLGPFWAIRPTVLIFVRHFG